MKMPVFAYKWLGPYIVTEGSRPSYRLEADNSRSSRKPIRAGQPRRYFTCEEATSGIPQ